MIPHVVVGWTEGEAYAVVSKKATASRPRPEEASVNVVDARVGDPQPYDAILDALNDERRALVGK
ncbi:MAG: hypothetical protein ACE5MI_12415 [Acidimicrobiia bacterium]